MAKREWNEDEIRAAYDEAHKDNTMRGIDELISRLTTRMLRPDQPVIYRARFIDGEPTDDVTTYGRLTTEREQQNVRALFTEDEIINALGRAMIHAGVSYDTGRVRDDLQAQLDAIKYGGEGCR